ncbi:hypothetical protein [Nonomuraea sediminis]|uniref:hypothetical protein n=1 Tax=Nonomuraea sediminis TaxID=2835864 RepID=UPI001BDC66AC|nr:hypothetical protein [Nonomuraea sediminis]
MPWDPSSGQTFGEWMRDGAPLGEGRTADVVVGERTWATRDQVEEGRTEEGGRYKAVRDQNGHHVIEETRPSGELRQHVQINL